MKKYASYVFPALLWIGVIVLGFLKITRDGDMWSGLPCNLDAVVIVLYMLWMAYETRVSHHDVTQEKAVSDHGTGVFYALGHGFTILSALWCDPLWRRPGPYHCIGLAVFLSGVILRLWSVRTLGRFYSHIVRTIADHRIVDTGPYRLLRHPAYTGMITAHLGITIFYFNCATLLIFSLLLIPSIVVRILVEEKTLMGIEGYAEFAKARKRILPLLW
ncbi:MAG: isoprenylcysteine carboxylmethyltransferase family protein [Spirochaetes bacterium]|nr:isoprenylcysteine carboxylmethyltransferase family protein [Spirochaetota bacterium]